MARSPKGQDTRGRDRILVAAGAAVAGLVAGVAVASGRRAAVEATDSLAGDWLDGLTAEHLEIIEAFDLIDASKPDKPSRRRKLAARLRAAIEKHAFQEETVVYPAARIAGADEAVAALITLQAEIKFQLYTLNQTDADDPFWTRTVEKLRRAVDAVISAEETEVFPVLRDKLDAKAAAHLTALVYRSGSKLG